MNNKKQEARGLWIDTDGWSKRLDAIVAQTPKIDHEDVFKRMDEAIEEIKTEKPKAGTLDDLIAAAVPLVVADEAESLLSQPVIDAQTGTELTPGDPRNCLGGDNHPEHPLCCDECDHFLTCFPEAMPKEEEDMEERYYTLIRYKCKRCGFELERRYASPEAYGGGIVPCTCGSFYLDPHPLWPRIGCRNGVDPHVDLEEYFETAPVEGKQEDVKKSLAAVFDYLHSDDD